MEVGFACMGTPVPEMIFSASKGVERSVSPQYIVGRVTGQATLTTFATSLKVAPWSSLVEGFSGGHNALSLRCNDEPSRLRSAGTALEG